MLQELKTYKYKQYTIKSLSKSIQIINVLENYTQFEKVFLCKNNES